MTQNALSEKEQKKAALDARSADMDRREKELNAGKTGVGLRTFLSMTRGKNPQEVRYDGFDQTQPDTLPKDIQGVLDILGLKPQTDEAAIVNLLIEGHNEVAYTTASDPLAEFIEDSWPDAAKSQFRLVVRNYSKGASVSLEDAVALIKPGFSKQFVTETVSA
jgi:hypothetical protein